MYKIKGIAVLITLFITIIAIASSCNVSGNVSNKNNDKNILYVLLSSPSSRAYFFTLKDNDVLIVKKGWGSLDEFINNKVISLEAKKELSKEQSKEINNIINNLGTFSGDKIPVFDYWEVSVCINNNTNHFTYGCSKNPKYDLLVTTLVKFSPIEVLDNYGNVVKPVENE